jgi:YbdK family carboxylate-amine ligase
MTDRRTVGVEEEFLIVERRSRRLAPVAAAFLERLPSEGFSAELQRSIIETNTTPRTDLTDVRRELRQLRGRLTAAGDAIGAGVVAAGTTPLTGIDGSAITPDERYQELTDNYQFLVEEQLICGAQVHVEIDDRDVAVVAAQRVEPWLPVLLALSASSPYWLDRDSGYASSRAVAWQRWPTAGMLGPFESAVQYDKTVADLIATGVISDAGMVYFDIRPNAHVPTLELRVCDACPLLDDVVLIAGLFRALITREIAAVERGEPPRESGGLPCCAPPSGGPRGPVSKASCSRPPPARRCPRRRRSTGSCRTCGRRSRTWATGR